MPAGVLLFVVSMVLTQFSIVRLCEVEDTLVGGPLPDTPRRSGLGEPPARLPF